MGFDGWPEYWSSFYELWLAFDVHEIACKAHLQELPSHLSTTSDWPLGMLATIFWNDAHFSR